MSTFRWLATIAIVLTLIAGIIGCEGISLTDRRPYEYDTPVAQRLADFHRLGPQGAQRRMDTFTDFDWDKVHIFSESTSYRFIDKTIGTPVFGRDGNYLDNSGILLFFINQGRVVHAVAFAPGYISGDAHTYSRDTAMLQAHTKDPGPYLLNLIDTDKPTP